MPPDTTDIKTAADTEYEALRKDAEAFRRIGQAGWVLMRDLEPEPLDYRRCPTCQSLRTLSSFAAVAPVPVPGRCIEQRCCLECRSSYRVTFRTVAVEAE